MEELACYLAKAIVCFPVHSHGISASRAGEGRCECVRVYRWELSILYFLLRFIVAHSIVLLLASPGKGEAKRPPVWKVSFLQHREP